MWPQYSYMGRSFYSLQMDVVKYGLLTVHCLLFTDTFPIMAYVFELYFDQAGETAVRQLWQSLAEAGVNDYMRTVGSTPHVTLAGFGDEVLDEVDLQAKAESFAAHMQPIPLTLSHLGVFNTDPAVVYAGVTMSFALLDAHRYFHTLLAEVGKRPFAYYLPNTWVPHCTLAERVVPDDVGKVVDHCRQLQLPLSVTAVRLGVVQPRTKPVRHLFTINISR